MLLVAVTGAAATAAPGRLWQFPGGLDAWQQPAGKCGVVTDPDDPRNHVYQIDTTKPHHTQLILRGSEATPDFVASLRFRVISFTGAEPNVYVYGRLAKGGFRGLVVHGSRAGVFCYFGQGRQNPTLGSVMLGKEGTKQGWVHAKLACFGDFVAAKVWLDGRREPRWQVTGRCPGQARGRFAVGVWTSPRTPSRATVQFDDLRFKPLTEEDLDAEGLQVSPRPPLDLRRVPKAGGRFETPALIGLATKATVVAFNRKTGDLAHVVDRASGREFVSPIVGRPLFSLRLTRPYAGESQQTTAADFRRVETRSAGSRGVELRFSEHAFLPLRVAVQAEAEEDGSVSLRWNAGNDSNYAMAGIAFPQMAFPAKLGENPDDDRLILPWADGSVLFAPGTLSQSRSGLYPGSAFTQFTAFFDPTAGLYLAALDSAGHCKRWTLRTARGVSVEMSLSHLRPETPRREVSLPYPVVLATFHGDWRTAADRYKRWAVRQPWCAKKLADRDDVPPFLKEGAGVLIAGIRNRAGRSPAVSPNFERLPELTAAYRRRTGLAHIIFVPYGWENRGTWAGINYFPAFPSNEAWIRINAELKAQGDRTAFLTSGFWWVIKRRRTYNGPAFDDTAAFKRREGMVIHRADGSPFLVDHYDRVGRSGDWRGLSAKLCHGSREARRTMRDVFLNVARLGVSLVSFDQEIGGGQLVPCYSKDHGHPPGYGTWMWADFRDLCAEILRRGKPIQPELGLFMENVSEQAIPYMATYWSRQFGEVDHGAVGARGVGLFSYLYHEYTTAIGAACVQGQGVTGTRPSPQLRRQVLANNLVRGLIPGPFLRSVPLTPTSKWQKEIAPAFFSYCRPYAHFPEYLLLGATRRPPKVDCHPVEAWFYRRAPNGKPLRTGGPKVRKVTVSLPAVAAGSFEANDGSAATVLVNTTLSPQEATVTVPQGVESVVLYDADRTVHRREKPAAHVRRVKVALEPLGTRVLVTR